MAAEREGLLVITTSKEPGSSVRRKTRHELFLSDESPLQPAEIMLNDIDDLLFRMTTALQTGKHG
jgi:hypothetical protein